MSKTLGNRNENKILKGGNVLYFCLGWICAAVLGVVLTCLGILDILKQILKELKEK